MVVQEGVRYTDIQVCKETERRRDYETCDNGILVLDIKVLQAT